MTGEQFKQWLAAMKEAGLAKTDIDCAELLQVHKNSIMNFKKDGTDKRIGLACQALLIGLQPFDGTMILPPTEELERLEAAMSERRKAHAATFEKMAAIVEAEVVELKALQKQIKAAIKRA